MGRACARLAFVHIINIYKHLYIHGRHLGEIGCTPECWLLSSAAGEFNARTQRTTQRARTHYLPNLPTYLPIYLTYLPTRPPAQPIHRPPTDSSLPPPLVYRYISGNDSRRRRCAFASSLTQPSWASSSHARPSRHSLYIDVYTRTEIPITAVQARQSFPHTVRGTQRIIFDVHFMCKIQDIYFDNIRARVPTKNVELCCKHNVIHS